MGLGGINSSFLRSLRCLPGIQVEMWSQQLAIWFWSSWERYSRAIDLKICKHIDAVKSSEIGWDCQRKESGKSTKVRTFRDYNILRLIEDKELAMWKTKPICHHRNLETQSFNEEVVSCITCLWVVRWNQGRTFPVGIGELWVTGNLGMVGSF